MLRSLKDINKYTVTAQDGEAVGKVHDFYFNDVMWVIRYLVVDLGVWLPGRKVLISPVALGQPDWGGGVTFPVQLEREKIEDSPDFDLSKPISRQQEAELHEFYEWPPYWGDVSAVDSRGAGMMPNAYLKSQKVAEKGVTERRVVSEQEATVEAPDTEDPHLRSINEITGYGIQAKDGEIGHVEDFIVEDDTWIIRYMVVDTRNWLPGKKVLVAPQWIEKISWPDSMVRVDLSRETIKNGPEYDPAEPVNRGYEDRLYDYYGRPKYWLEGEVEE